MALTFIRPNDLPAASAVLTTSALVVDDGLSVEKATPAQVVNAGRPVASEAEAIAGLRNDRAITPLTLAQVLDGYSPATTADAVISASTETVQQWINRSGGFATRADFVSAVAYPWSVGAVVSAGGYDYRYTGSGTLISDLPGWVPHGDVYPDHFTHNEVPGTTDMLPAIQAAIDYSAASNVQMRMAGSVYAVAGSIIGKEGMRIRGAGNWSGTTFLNPTLGTTVIRYTGAGGADTCVLRLSKQPVGTQGAASDNMSNITVTHITIDGNELADIGVYCNRSWSNNQLDYITASNTVSHGFWVGNCWNGSPTNWHAYKNIGAGISLGINTYGWSQCTVDQSTLISFFGYYSGMALDEFVSRNVMTPANPGVEYGIGISNGRGLILINPQANECSGPGLYVTDQTLNAITIIGGYFENNGRSSVATARWDMWYDATTATLGMSMIGTHWGVASTGVIKITGTPSSGRPENALKFVNIPILPTINADHEYYRLIDCDEDPVAIIGSQPIYFAYKINAAKNLAPMARVHFWIDPTGNVPRKTFAEGVPVTITYNAAGDYTLTLSETQPSGNWVCEAHSTADNRYVRAGDYTGSTCRIYHKSLSNVAADPTASNIAIRCVIYGSRT